MFRVTPKIAIARNLKERHYPGKDLNKKLDFVKRNPPIYKSPIQIKFPNFDPSGLIN